ncbi:MAG: DUF6893 family small protein [Sciscionella sp.]
MFRKLLFLLVLLGAGAAVAKVVAPDVKRYLDMRDM